MPELDWDMEIYVEPCEPVICAIDPDWDFVCDDQRWGWLFKDVRLANKGKLKEVVVIA
jgi:hypothetical protein